MAKKVTPLDLEKEVMKILDEYGQDVNDNLGEIVTEMTKKGVKALRKESEATFGTSKSRSKKYAKTWTSQMETGRLSKQGSIYNSQPGLPHLLEFGHVSANGTGRGYSTEKAPVKGRKHIEKVEQELVKLFEREVKSKL